MNQTQIHQLIATFPGEIRLVETHISWVLLGPELVYKVRKPIRYAFLDFSTIALRKADCEKELVLNQRTSPHIYRQVVSIAEDQGRISVGAGANKVIDYAVEMVRLDNDRQMDVLLQKGEVSATDMSVLSTIVRETYMHLFAEHDYLKDFAAQIGAESEPPIIGDLVPSSVIKSTYFFC